MTNLGHSGRVMVECNESLYAALVCADSVTSLVAHRHSSELPDDVREELLSCSAACRKLSEAIKPRRGLAVYVCTEEARRSLEAAVRTEGGRRGV